MYEIVMKPGYLLYLPSQWAHNVTNESNSIMINYWYCYYIIYTESLVFYKEW